MSDEFDIVYLGEDEVNEVVQWATGTAALLVSLELDVDELRDGFSDDPWDAIEALVDTLSAMREAMPTVLTGPAEAIAIDAFEEVEKEEAEVESFRKEIEKFNQGE